MNRLTLTILWAIGLVIVISGCAPDTAVPATLAVTRVVVVAVTNTAVASHTPITTATATISPTPETTPTTTVTNIPVITPTKTPRPTSTPRPTATPIFYDLPAWVSDPAADVLLLYTEDNRGRNKTVTLFNAQTGERFDIPVDDYSSPTWKQIDGELYIDLSARAFTYDHILVRTGQLMRIEAPSLVTSGARHIPSPDGRYLIRVVEEENIPAITTLVNQETTEEIELTDPFNSEYADHIRIEWSPDGQLISVERVRHIEDPTAPYGTRSESALAIFLLDGTVLAQYRDIGDGILKWSPANPYQILYSPFSYTNEPPCIYNVVLGDYGCIEEVAQWRDAEEVNLSSFNWSPDGNKIGFVYWAGSSNSGFCYVKLSTDSIVCPITWDDLQIDEYLERFGQAGIAYVSVINYQWSPNGQYLALAVGPFPPTSDDRGFDTLAIAKSGGELLWVIVDGKLPHYDPWRPAIPLQIEE